MKIDAHRIDRFSTATLRLQEVMWSDANWVPALKAIAALFDAESAFVRIIGDVSQEDIFWMSYGYSDSDFEEYARDFAHEDHWRIDGVPKLVSGRPMTGDTLAPRSKLQTSGMLNDFLIPRGVTDCLATPLTGDETVNAYLVLNGSGEDGRFRPSHLKIAHLLKGHLAQVSNHRRRMALVLRDRFDEGLTNLGMGVAYLDDRGRLLHETELFRTFANAAGIFRPCPQGGVAYGNDVIGRLVHSVITGWTGGEMRLRDGCGNKLLLKCAPAPRDAVDLGYVDNAAVAITLEFSGNAAIKSLEAAAERWGLTDRERDALLSLARVKAIPRAAGDLGVAYETMRNYAKRIYIKAGVHSLPDLITAASSAPIDGSD